MSPTAAMIDAAKEALIAELDSQCDMHRMDDPDRVVLHAGCTPRTSHIKLNVLDIVTSVLAATYRETIK